MLNEKIIKICEQKFIYLNYSQKTSENYMCHIKKFIGTIGCKQIIHLNSKDFQNYLNNYSFSSVSQQNQVINSIRFLYKFGLEKKYDKVSFKRPKSEKKLPLVIESEYLKKTILAIPNLKHKAILMLGYSCSLRVSEVINLKIIDIDSKRMLVNIRNAKGRKDRVVVLSPKLLETLRAYFLKFKPKEYLFNGQFDLRYSSNSCNKIVKKYLDNSYHFHTLRHSGATTMLENGTDISIIQKLLGHKDVKTTMMYTHISRNLLSNVVMPM